MPTSVALTPRFETFVREQVDSGRYNNVSEVVRDALRLLEQSLQEEAVKLEGLRQAAKEGFGAIDRGEYTLLDATEIESQVATLGQRAKSRAKSR